MFLLSYVDRTLAHIDVDGADVRVVSQMAQILTLLLMDSASYFGSSI